MKVLSSFRFIEIPLNLSDCFLILEFTSECDRNDVSVSVMPSILACVLFFGVLCLPWLSGELDLTEHSLLNHTHDHREIISPPEEQFLHVSFNCSKHGNLPEEWTAGAASFTEALVPTNISKGDLQIFLQGFC